MHRPWTQFPRIPRHWIMARLPRNWYAHFEAFRRIATTCLRFFPSDPRLAAEMRVIARSGFFDASFYLSMNPDVADAGEDPLRHYCLRGAAEDRMPNPLFDGGVLSQTLSRRARQRHESLSPLPDPRCPGRPFSQS